MPAICTRRDGLALEQRRAGKDHRRDRPLQQGDVHRAGPVAGEIEQHVEAGIAAERHGREEAPVPPQFGQMREKGRAHDRQEHGADEQPAQRHHGHGRDGADRRAADDAIGAPHRRGQHQQQHRALVEASRGPTEKCAQSGLFPKGNGRGPWPRFALRPAEAPCNPGKRAWQSRKQRMRKKRPDLVEKNSQSRPHDAAPPPLACSSPNAPCSALRSLARRPRRRRARASAPKSTRPRGSSP